MAKKDKLPSEFDVELLDFLSKSVGGAEHNPPCQYNEEGVKNYVFEAVKNYIDYRASDEVLMFRNILTSVKEVFGEENMTEAVMVKAIEAGSYGVWRKIMGESKETVIAPTINRNRR